MMKTKNKKEALKKALHEMQEEAIKNGLTQEIVDEELKAYYEEKYGKREERLRKFSK